MKQTMKKMALVNQNNIDEFEAKLNADDIELELEVRGTRKPANRAERRKATAHAKNRRKELAEYADDPWGGIEFNSKTGNVKRWAGFAVQSKVKNRKTRYEGKNLPEERTDWFADGAYWYEMDAGALDFDNWFFEYENGETWEQCLARKKFNAESGWNWQTSMMKAPGFYEAKNIIRLNHEVEILEAKKKALLDEYASKMEAINTAIRRRYDQMAVVKGEEPPYQF